MLEVCRRQPLRPMRPLFSALGILSCAVSGPIGQERRRVAGALDWDKWYELAGLMTLHSPTSWSRKGS
jgi:hypothetical protein